MTIDEMYSLSKAYIEDELYSDRALTEPAYRDILFMVLEERSGEKTEAEECAQIYQGASKRRKSRKAP
jgi:hypothetical protein